MDEYKQTKKRVNLIMQRVKSSRVAMNTLKGEIIKLERLSDKVSLSDGDALKHEIRLNNLKYDELVAKMYVDRFNTTMEFMREEDPVGWEVFKLKHINGNNYIQIEAKVFISKNTITKKLKKMESLFVRFMRDSREVLFGDEGGCD